MSMPVITLTSSSKTGSNISHPPEISKNIREASFSSYLDGAEEAFVLTLGGANTQKGLISPSISTTHDHIFLGKNKTEDKEIDVFDAEKYFKEGLNHSPKVGAKNLPNHTSMHKKVDPLEIFTIKDQNSIPTLSVRSESSWNSRRALLHTVPRNQQQPRKANKKSFLKSISCNCSCADKNSVDIDDYMAENCSIKSTSTCPVNLKSRQGDKTSDHLVRKSNSDYNCIKFDEPELRVNSDGHFSFPVFNSKTVNHAAKSQQQEEEEEEEVEVAKKKSLQVFGSPILEKKLTMISWDSISPGLAEDIQIPSISSEMQNDDDDDDSDSDASSDLFEIESFSKGNHFLSRQASDGLSGCITPTTSYAPSEASIEWSVVTASAADFSVLSDSEELRSNSFNTTTMPCSKKTGQNSKIGGSFREIPKLRSSILSGCKSQKAVRVAGDAHSKRNNQRGESFIQMTRLHSESKVAGFDSISRQQSFDARVLPSQSRSGSAAAHLLYT